MSEAESVFIKYLKEQKKIKKHEIKFIDGMLVQINKRKADDNDEEPQPHLDEDGEEKTKDGDAPKKKKSKKVVEGPCVGRIWLDPTEECPGPEAKRGRNPVKNATTFEGTWFKGAEGKKTKKVLCLACKGEYKKWTKEQKNKE